MGAVGKVNIVRKGELFYDSDGNVIGFVPNPSTETRQRYIASVQWVPEVETFSPGPGDVAPDGRRFGGQRVGDLRDARGHTSLRAPNGSMQDVDLSSYGDDDRVRINWVNETARRRHGPPPSP